MEPLLPKAIVFAVLTATATLAAHRMAAVYHDGLRTSLPGLWSGEADRPGLTRYAYSISIGFVLGYALPFTLMTGVVAIWLVLLPAEVIALRYARLPVALLVALAWGAAVSLAADLARTMLVDPTPGLEAALLSPLALAVPLAAPLAGAKLHGLRAAAILAIVEVAVWRLVDTIAGHADPLRTWTPTGGAIGLLAATVPLVALALRPGGEQRAVTTDPTGVTRIRRHWPYLLLPPGLLAVTASQGWLGGDPFQIALMRLDAPDAAAIAAIWVAIGFFPLIALTGIVSGVWSQDGYADWYLAAGYVARHPLAAFAAAIALVGIEISSLSFVHSMLETRPGVHRLATAAREALDDLAVYAVLAGGVSAGALFAGGLGVFVAVGAYALNELRGRPVMPAAAPLVGVLALAAGAAGARALAVFQ